MKSIKTTIKSVIVKNTATVAAAATTSFVFLLFTINTKAFANPNQTLEPFPEDPLPVTLANAANFRLAGYCDSGDGDVSISFGTLNFTAPCNDFLGYYEIFENVSSETVTNPIKHCVTQAAYPERCSKVTSNTLAPPGMSFNLNPLPLITAANGSPGSMYRVDGVCAPSGATVSIDFGGGQAVISGVCETLNSFTILGDVSSLADGTNIQVVGTISDGTDSGSDTSIVNKFLEPDPVPQVTAVTASETDQDSDSWLEAGDYIDFVLDFTEPVIVDSTVSLNFILDSNIKSATYLSGSFSTSVTFRLTVSNGDELCSGPLNLSGINLLGGTGIKDFSGQDADLAAVPASYNFSPIDAVEPTFGGSFDLGSSNALPTQSPKFVGEGFNISENCPSVDFSGTLENIISGAQVQTFTTLPNSSLVDQEYRFLDSVDGFSFSLQIGELYKANFRVRDQAGNTAIRSSIPWVVSPIAILPDLIVHLTGLVPSSIIDTAGVSSNQAGFNTEVQNFLDVSESPVVHDFTAGTATGTPIFQAATNELEFDGVDDCMVTPNHPELNSATVTQRSYGLLFRAPNNTVTRQMIFEEGAQIRGMNVYIDNNRLYCGFWNERNDGDGFQAFIGHSVLIQPNRVYSVSPVFDYTNYSGPTGPDGTFNCYIDGVAMGADLPSTSRLFSHTGDVSLGCNGGATIQHDGRVNENQYFQGNILEVLVFNNPPNSAEALEVYNYLRLTWDL